MADDLQPGPGRRRRAWRWSWTSSIRTRVLIIVLIPSAALLITGASVSGYLISAGLTARDYAAYLQHSVGPIVQVEAAEEQERTISLEALGGDRQALAGLQAQWDATDAALADTARAGSVEQGINPGALASTIATLNKLAAQLPTVRSGVRTRRASATEVDAFYTQLANVGGSTILLTALSAPDSAAAVDGITVQDLLSAVDLHSRAVGLGAGWVTRGVLNQPDFQETIAWASPPTVKRPDVFFSGEQGVLNYVAAKKAQAGEISLQSVDFGRWIGDPAVAALSVETIAAAGYPFVLHWAGPKPSSIRRMQRRDILEFFESFYYSRIPHPGLARRWFGICHSFASAPENARKRFRKMGKWLRARAKQALRGDPRPSRCN